jgi:hypothetical protein
MEPLPSDQRIYDAVPRWEPNREPRLADLLVLDRDYLTAPAEEIKGIVPVATMARGRIVHGSLPQPGHP